MRIAFILLFTFSGICSFAQRPVLENETITYSQSTFFNGSSIKLASGTREDSTFAYVLMGKAHLPAYWKNLTIRVEEVYKKGGKYYAKGDLYNGKKMIGLAGNKVVVDVERAIDNKEIIDAAQ